MLRQWLTSSYPTRRERALAEALHAALMHAGADVFLDTDGIDAGADFVGRLQSAVGGAGRLVLLAGPAAMASEWVRNEVHGFIAKNPDFLRLGRLIPVATHAVTPLPVFLSSVNLLDATQGASFLTPRRNRRPGRRRRGTRHTGRSPRTSRAAAR